MKRIFPIKFPTMERVNKITMYLAEFFNFFYNSDPIIIINNIWQTKYGMLGAAKRHKIQGNSYDEIKYGFIVIVYLLITILIQS